MYCTALWHAAREQQWFRMRPTKKDVGTYSGRDGGTFASYGQFIFRQPQAVLEFTAVDPSIARWNYTAFIEGYSLGSKVAV